MNKIINKVPHPLTIVTNEGKKIKYPASKNPIRLILERDIVLQKIGEEVFQLTKEYATEISIKDLIYKVTQLLWRNNDYLVISRLAQEYLPENYTYLHRVFSPGNLIRENGTVIGAIGFTTRIFYLKRSKGINIKTRQNQC